MSQTGALRSKVDSSILFEIEITSKIYIIKNSVTVQRSALGMIELLINKIAGTCKIIDKNKILSMFCTNAHVHNTRQAI